MHPYVHIKRVSYIHTGTVIGPNVAVGETIAINSLCGISSRAKIGDYCYVEVGTRIIQKIEIAKNTTLGAGSVVIKDLPGNCLAAGVPKDEESPLLVFSRTVPHNN